MEHIHQTAASRGKNSYSATPWFWLVLAVTGFIGLGPASECLAFTVSPTALTFTADQGATNPQSQTLSVYRSRTNQVTLAAPDNASWVEVSPATASMTSTAQLTVAVNTSGLAAGTYNSTITIKVGNRVRTTVPVTLTVSPSSQPPPPSATTATLAWGPVNDPTLDGYKVYVGTTSGLYTRTITVGNLTSYTVDSLTTRTTYYFSVTAYNSAGESLPSNEVSKSIY
jgi:hypothetical protein